MGIEDPYNLSVYIYILRQCLYSPMYFIINQIGIFLCPPLPTVVSSYKAKVRTPLLEIVRSIITLL